LALPDADCAEQPIGWQDTISQCFDGSPPSDVMVEILGRNAMEGRRNYSPPIFPHGGIMTGFPAKALAIAWSAVRPTVTLTKYMK
jgi:hypothetical protein